MLTCLYCAKVFSGGGINGVKYHRARIQGQVTICKKIPSDVREEMIKAIKKIETKKKEASDFFSVFHEAYYDNPPSLEKDDELEEEEDIEPARKKQKSKGKRENGPQIEQWRF